MIWTQHVLRDTTRVQDQPAAMLALLDRPTWMAIRLHRVWLVLQGVSRRLVRLRAQSVRWAEWTMIRIHRRHVCRVWLVSSALLVRLPVLDARVVVLMWTQTRRRRVRRVRLASTQLRM